MKRSMLGLPLAALAAVLAAPTLAMWQSPKLPPGTLRGPADSLQQYPTVSLASRAQQEAAVRVLVQTANAVRAFRDPRAAVAAGYDITEARRARGDRSVGWLHAEHRGHSNDRTDLDPRHPEVLIYANPPGGRPLRLVGVMYSVPRGVKGPTPGGPVTRWHNHRVCAEGRRRGLTPRPDGTCPPGATPRRGSEMMHLWFTHDLRSAYAIHAPVPELCHAGRLARVDCGANARHARTM